MNILSVATIERIILIINTKTKSSCIVCLIIYCFAAPSVADVQSAIEYIFPLVYEFRKEKTAEEMALHALKRRRLSPNVQETICDDPFSNKENENSGSDEDESWN